MSSRPFRSPSRSLLLTVALTFVFGAFGLFLPRAQAASSGSIIALRVGQTADVTQANLSRVAIADPSIADITVQGNDVQITAHHAGKTTLLLWSSNAPTRTEYVVEVGN